jgi:hypothetical protein
MAKPASRQELKDYALRQLGAPVLEINVDDEQMDDRLDDALQLFYERHFDGVERVYLKYKLTEDDIKRGRARGQNESLGITTYTTSSGNFEENSNFINLPDFVIGVERIFKFDNTTVSNNFFNYKYQLFLNDVAFNVGYGGLLNYSMVRTYVEEIDFLISTTKQIRFNKRNNRLYLDIDWGTAVKDTYIIIDCQRIMDPSDYTGVYNDSWLKMYFTALLKKQWGQNLIKFQGVRLPGGVELNGRQIYDDAVNELESIRQRMLSEYETAPFDAIG